MCARRWNISRKEVSKMKIHSHTIWCLFVVFSLFLFIFLFLSVCLSLSFLSLSLLFPFFSHSSFFIRLFIMFYCCFSWTYVFCVVNIDARVPLCHCVYCSFRLLCRSFLLLQIFYMHSNRSFICIRRFNEYIFLRVSTKRARARLSFFLTHTLILSLSLTVALLQCDPLSSLLLFLFLFIACAWTRERAHD